MSEESASQDNSVTCRECGHTANLCKHVARNMMELLHTGDFYRNVMARVEVLENALNEVRKAVMAMRQEATGQAQEHLKAALQAIEMVRKN